jgi:hypothetical protein
VTQIDRSTKFLFTKTINKKSEVDDHFKFVRAHILTQIGVRTKLFVSDGEGKYLSGDFQYYLKAKGILHQQTPTNTPQRNPFSERMNLTILNIVRCIMLEPNVPKHLWGEAVIFTTYLINCTISKGETKSRYELLYGKKPNVDHIHKFGTYV